MARFTYYDYINGFCDLIETISVTSNAQLLYHTLLMIFNKAHWVGEIQRTNYSICGICGLGQSAMSRARNELKQLNLIDFTPDKRRGQATKYRLCKPFCTSQIEVQNENKSNTNQIQNENKPRTYKDIRLKTKDNNTPKAPKSESPKKYTAEIEEIIEYLNQKAGTHYRASGSETQKHIRARLGEGFVVADFKRAIDSKTAEWIGTEMQTYLRPQTLFGPKFESYVNSVSVARKADERDFDVYRDEYDHTELEELTRK